MARHKIAGNTYPHRTALKSLGCRWDPSGKVWYTSDAKVAEQATAIVAGKATAKSSASRRCSVCGNAEERDARGYTVYGTKILRSGECGDCYEERKMGY